MNDRSLDGVAGGIAGAPTRGAGASAHRRSGEGFGAERGGDGLGAWMLRGVRVPLHDLITTIFPAECRVCDEPLVGAGRVPVCAQCLRAAVRPVDGLVCRVCGDALGMENERILRGLVAERRMCTPCRLVRPEFERAVSAGVYADEMRELLHLLKYEGVRVLAGPLGGMLAGALEELSGEFTVEVLLVPVPLFGARRRERGFNQAAVLAEAARGEMRRRRPGVRLRVVAGALERTRATESQFALNPAQRRRNVRGAFRVSRPELVAGREVVLVDDIYTTGATARACAAVLVRAGARRVWVATVARAQAEGGVAMWDGERREFAGMS